MTIYFQNLRIEAGEGVYEPAEDSFLLAEKLDVERGDEVLDMGTGTGIIALSAARKAGRVLGVDINPDAVRLASINAGLNGFENTEFRESDLFSRVDGMFDLITFNPPYLPVDDGKGSEMWSGGAGGVEVLERFVVEACSFLKEGGNIRMLVSSLNGLDYVRGMVGKTGFKSQVIAGKRFFFEELYVLTASRM
ncbi:MAG: HemK2/MTQ2 family protein methyltransferase [Candidatus Altiarchaeota archaeon]